MSRRIATALHPGWDSPGPPGDVVWQSERGLGFSTIGKRHKEIPNFPTTPPACSPARAIATRRMHRGSCSRRDSRGSGPTLTNPSGYASAAPFNDPTTSIQEWNLNVEQQIGKDAALQIAYVGTHGVHESYIYNLNQPMQPLDSNFGPAPNYGRPYFGTVPNIAAIRTNSNIANQHTHQLQVKFEKRFSSGWSVLNSYTWQHTIGQTPLNEAAGPQNDYNLRAERGNQDPDFRSQFSSAWSYILPFGPGQRFLKSSGPIRYIASGWRSQGILSMFSGEATTPELSYDRTNTGSGAPRPDLTGNPLDFSSATSWGCPANKQNITCWYNPAAYAVPALAPGQTFATEFGDAGVGTLRGPALYNLDSSLFKSFDLREGSNLELRGEVFIS